MVIFPLWSVWRVQGSWCLAGTLGKLFQDPCPTQILMCGFTLLRGRRVRWLSPSCCLLFVHTQCWHGVGSLVWLPGSHVSLENTGMLWAGAGLPHGPCILAVHFLRRLMEENEPESHKALWLQIALSVENACWLGTSP